MKVSLSENLNTVKLIKAKDMPKGSIGRVYTNGNPDDLCLIRTTNFAASFVRVWGALNSFEIGILTDQEKDVELLPEGTKLNLVF